MESSRRNIGTLAVMAAITFSLLNGSEAAHATGAGWTTYAFDNSRDGLDSGDPASSAVSSLWNSATLDGSIYAQPLVYGSEVIVVTENDSVYGLSTATGSQLWYQHLGTPVPSSSLPCGNINPVGITSTPVIDPSSSTIYVMGLLNSPSIHYQLFALNASTGGINWQQTVAPGGFNPATQNQRGALGLSNNNVVMVFGGRYGDCGTYSGWVMTYPESGSGSLNTWNVNSISSDNGSGIWAPNGESIDGSGNIYVATGNSTSTGLTWNGSEAVLKLSPSLSLIDWWFPGNWRSLSTSDTDMGPAPMQLSASALFVTGKAGDGYLLNPGRLSSSSNHQDGELYTAHVCPGLYADAVFGGTAFDGGRIYVPCDNGLVALTFNASNNSFSFAWQSSETNAGPPIVADGLIWDEDYGANTIYAYTPNGATVFSAPLGSNTHFGSPSASGGNIYVPAGKHIATFTVNTSAGTKPLSGYSWDQGLFAQIAPDNSAVHAWGQRQTPGFWGTGPVNYQSGGTRNDRAPSSGSLTYTMSGTYCPNNQCTYGTGSGYKGLVQLWNDPNNYIAFGLIHDPGVSPTGTTIMVEGAGNGSPVGGYWPSGAISGDAHSVTVSWSYIGVTFTLDNAVTLGPYAVAATQPSISFLAAGRGTGDICDTTFTGISFSFLFGHVCHGSIACHERQLLQHCCGHRKTICQGHG
jgi:hypothetical protein